MEGLCIGTYQIRLQGTHGTGCPQMSNYLLILVPTKKTHYNGEGGEGEEEVRREREKVIKSTLASSISCSQNIVPVCCYKRDRSFAFSRIFRRIFALFSSYCQ